MRKIGTGRTAEIFEYSEAIALKLFYKQFSAAADSEFTKTKMIASCYSGCAACYDLIEYDGRKGITYELIKGKMLSEILIHNIKHMKKLIKKMSAIHQEMNSIEIAGLPDMNEKFITYVKEYKDSSESEKKIIIAFINKQRKQCLCHGDFHVENIMVTENHQYRVIDFDCAGSGNPLADVARSYYLFKYSKSPVKRSFVQNILETLFKSVAAKIYVREYFTKSIPKKDLKRWLYIIMIARLRENIKEEEMFLIKSINKANVSKLFSK